MKKWIAGMLVMVMSLAFLAGCGADPVAEELEKFINEDMKEVLVLYDEIATEAGRWGELETDADIIASLEGTLLPKIDASAAILKDIAPETEEVKALKAKFDEVITAYKEGFGQILEGAKAEDAEKMTAGSARVEEGVAFCDAYNQAAEALAAEKGLTIE